MHKLFLLHKKIFFLQVGNHYNHENADKEDKKQSPKMLYIGLQVTTIYRVPKKGKMKSS